jgi:hypothetical protein
MDGAADKTSQRVVGEMAVYPSEGEVLMLARAVIIMIVNHQGCWECLAKLPDPRAV